MTLKTMVTTLRLMKMTTPTLPGDVADPVLSVDAVVEERKLADTLLSAVSEDILLLMLYLHHKCNPTLQKIKLVIKSKPRSKLISQLTSMIVNQHTMMMMREDILLAQILSRYR